MMKRLMYILTVLLSLGICVLPSWSEAADYGKRLSASERRQICDEIKSARQQSPQTPKDESLGGGIIPDTVLSSIYNTTRQISDSVSLVLVLGHALTCNAVHANKQEVTILGVRLFSYPNIPVWLCGAIIYFMGFMLTLSVTFYLVDIAFKLGFAVIMLPIGVALWPFPPTRDKLAILISIILKNAAIFAFLAVTVSYALNLIGEAGGGLEDIFDSIDRNETDTITENFSLFSSNFLIVMFALVYGMKLIGSTITDYVDKFFPDKAFGGGQKASPIHGSMTQAMDFAKKKVAAPVASFAGDVAKTQLGRATAATGKLLTGGYNQQLKNAGKSIRHYVTHPDEAVNKGTKALGKGVGKLAGGAGKLANNIVMGTAGRIVLGNNARKSLQEKINSQIDKGLDKYNQFTDKAIDKTTQPLTKAVDKASQRLNETADKFSKTKTAERMNNINQGARTAGGAIQKGYNKTLNAFGKAQQGIDDFKNKINKPIDNLAKKAYRGIDKLEQGADKGIDKFKNGVNQPIDKLKRQAYEQIDKALGRKAGDSKLTAAGKAFARGVLKAPTALITGAAKLPANVIAGGAKLSTMAISGALKAPTAVLSGVAKAPAAVAAGLAKAPIKIAETATKALNIFNVSRVTGNILMKAGESMQHNKKPEGWSASQGETESEKEQRLQNEAEETQFNKRTWG